MRRFLRAVGYRWLIALLFSAAVFSLGCWLTKTAVHLAAVLLLLALWLGLAAAAAHFGRRLWVLLLVVLTEGMTLLFCDRGALFGAFFDVWSGARAAASLYGDVAALMLLVPISAAAFFLWGRFWPRAVLSLGWLIFWVTAALLELAVPKLALAAMVPILLFTLIEALHRRAGTSFSQLSSGLVALLSAGVLLVAMPSSPEPYGFPLLHSLWDQLETLYHRVETDLFFRQAGQEQFGMDFNGFSEEADTRNSPGRSSGEALFAKPRYTTNGSLYLAGNRWDTFADGAWYSTLGEEDAALLGFEADTAEHIYALWRYQRDREEPLGVSALVRENNVYLAYENLNTRTLFTAPNLLLVQTDAERYPFTGYADGVLFDYVQKRDTWYRLYYLEENALSVPELIAEEEGSDYSADADLHWYDVAQSYRSQFLLDWDNSVRLDRFFPQRQARIYEVYLTLPADCSDRVRTLAAEITADCDSNYEKLMAIQRYLQTNYTYTTAPDPVPPGTPFLDYLLFDAKEGYCTWYATAATVLARSVGVPARYVQGYRVALEGGEFTAVTGRDSHAWGEGYVPGWGWVTVEATPGFIPGGGWEFGRTGSGDYTGGAGVDSYEEEFWEELESMAPEQPQTTGEQRPSLLPKVLLALLVLVVLILLFASAFRHERVRRAYLAADYADKAVMDLERLLRALSRRGYSRRPEESLRQYFARLRWSPLVLDREKLEAMSNFYEELLFGERPVTQEEWAEARQFVEELSHPRRRRRRW